MAAARRVATERRATRAAAAAATAVVALVMAFATTAPATASPAGFRAASLPAGDPAPSRDLTPIKNTVDFPVGAAIDTRETTGVPSQLLLRHFSQVTPENAMKPEAWYDASHQFSPSPDIATLMNFAAKNGLRVYGHVLVWHSQIPAWFFQRDDGTPLTDSPGDQDILKARMHDHIFGVAKYLSDNWGAFGGGNPVVAFDVVNEAVADGGGDALGMRQTEWYRVLGEQYVDLAFGYADEAFNKQYAAPGATRPVTLFINDYNTDQPTKRTAYLALIDRLLARGVPIGGIGHQFHVSLDVPVSNLADALDDSGGRGLVQAVTEMDVPTGTPPSDSKSLKQGFYYRDAFRIFRDRAKELFSVTVWGLYDARSWRDSQGGPLIFDDALRAKPAYYGIVEGHSDEPPLGQYSAPRNWIPYWIALGVVAVAAAMVAPRFVRARRRAARRRGLLEAGGATREGAVDALSRPLAAAAPRARGLRRRKG